ncbi:2'-5' RNA ligase family protein [Enterovirga sp.]|uniref:2'-5' RNA ligase family protein n=1 Tax=Enterovirga sp. TaxID=2026350 RepID=UPI003453A308
MDGASFARLDALRRLHFPPDRNQVPAHLTLFHALPGTERDSIVRHLAALAVRQRSFSLEATGFRSLGHGVALAFASAELVRLRQALAREWADWLSAQDSARIAPHVTVQNKVAPEAARRLLAELQGEFQPFTARAEGLLLWRYLGGPWERLRLFRFAA